MPVEFRQSQWIVEVQATGIAQQARRTSTRVPFLSARLHALDASTSNSRQSPLHDARYSGRPRGAIGVDTRFRRFRPPKRCLRCALSGDIAQDFGFDCLTAGYDGRRAGS